MVKYKNVSLSFLLFVVSLTSENTQVGVGGFECSQIFDLIQVSINRYFTWPKTCIKVDCIRNFL